MQAEIKRRSPERGSALVIVLITILVAAGLAVALVVTATSRSQSTEAQTKLERALAVAEAGLDRGIAECNKSANRTNPAFPAVGGTTLSAADSVVLDDNGNKVGSYTVTMYRGDSDGTDNDGDALIDGADTDEDIYIVVVSQGTVGSDASAETPFKASVRAQIVKLTSQFAINSAVFIDDATPNLALGSGAAWTLSGSDHDMITDALTGGTPLPAVATSGAFDATDTAAIIANTKADIPGTEPGEHIGVGGLETGSLGVGGGPGSWLLGHAFPVGVRFAPPFTGKASTSTTGTGQIDGANPVYENGVAGYDMDSFVQWAKDNVDPANHVTGSGVGLAGPFGTPPTSSSEDWQITYHDAGGPGNLVKFTGGAPDGAGIWVVDGDLELAGNFTYTGIIIVTGSLWIRGGGGNKMVLGAVITGEASVDNVDVNGTIDLHYSSGAVSSAANAAARFVMVSWEQIPQ